MSLLGELFAIEADFFFDVDKHRQGLTLLLDGCRKHKCLKVAEHNREIIGMCSGQTLISTAEGGVVAMVEDLVVKTGWRGKGVGRMLLESMEAWSNSCGLKRLQLLADSENDPALEFYQKNGWKVTQLICLRKRFR
ncbi:MAG: GNAT family N-acetyltransferase [Desulfosalsimonadaceae bacterium]